MKGLALTFAIPAALFVAQSQTVSITPHPSRANTVRDGRKFLLSSPRGYVLLNTEKFQQSIPVSFQPRHSKYENPD